MWFTAMCTLRRIPHTDSIILRKEDLEADNVQVDHLLHEAAMVFGIFLQRMDMGERRRSNKVIIGSTEVCDSLSVRPFF